MSKPKCKKCNKVPNEIMSIYLNTNRYEFYCNECFVNKILKQPNYVNRIATIRYNEYLD